jgi:hypothetical protein
MWEPNIELNQISFKLDRIIPSAEDLPLKGDLSLKNSP